MGETSSRRLANERRVAADGRDAVYADHGRQHAERRGISAPRRGGGLRSEAGRFHGRTLVQHRMLHRAAAVHLRQRGPQHRVRAGDDATRFLGVSQHRVGRRRQTLIAVARGDLQPDQHAAIQQSQRFHRIAAGGCHQFRRFAAILPAHVAADSDCGEAAVLMPIDRTIGRRRMRKEGTMKHRPFVTGLLYAGLMFCLTGAARAQTSEVTGRVTDQAAAIVDGAEITITNIDTGASRRAVTNSEGYYTVPLLQPGRYRLTARKDGFKPIARDGVMLEVGQTARLDFTLEAGNVTDTVTITEQAPLLASETSSLGQVIDGKKITNIPLNGRSPFRLVQLTPGVLSSNSANGQFGDIPVNTTFDSNFSINGGRSQSNEVTIDGVPSTAGFFNQITTIPSVEAAQEFKVESNNVSAEFGRFGGGVINVSTRSGGKDAHGARDEFLRNDAFDANDFFNNRAGRQKPPFRMNQFGGSISGPVWLPEKVFGPASYDGRAKTFFFADYQGTRWRRGDVFFTTVPTELERRGDFSQTRDAQGRLVTIYDPLTTRANPNYNAGQAISGANTPFIRTPFAGNIIPRERLDPIALAIIQYYPLPNNQGQQFTNINNFASNAKRRVDGDQYSARVDHNFSERYRAFVRFSRNKSALTQPDYFNNVASPNPGAVGTTPFLQHTIANDHTITLTPTVILNLRYGYARWFQSRVTRSYGFDQTALGFPAALVAQQQVPVFPLITAEGYSNLAA